MRWRVRLIAGLERQNCRHHLVVKDLIAVHTQHPVVAGQRGRIIHLRTVSGIRMMVNGETELLANLQRSIRTA